MYADAHVRASRPTWAYGDWRYAEPSAAVAVGDQYSMTRKRRTDELTGRGGGRNFKRHTYITDAEIYRIMA